MSAPVDIHLGAPSPRFSLNRSSVGRPVIEPSLPNGLCLCFPRLPRVPLPFSFLALFLFSVLDVPTHGGFCVPTCSSRGRNSAWSFELRFCFCFCCCPGGRPPSDAVFRSCLPFSPVSAFARICAAFVYLTDLVTCPVLTPGVPFWRPHFSPDARLVHVTASGEVAVTVQDRGGPSRRGGGAGVCPRAGSCSGLVFLGSGGEAAGREAPRGRAGESAVRRPPGAAGVLPRRGASASDVRPGVAAPVMTGEGRRGVAGPASLSPVVCMKACGLLPRLDRQTQATTLVHQIFGGYLRSRGKWRRARCPCSCQGPDY